DRRLSSGVVKSLPVTKMYVSGWGARGRFTSRRGIQSLGLSRSSTFGKLGKYRSRYILSSKRSQLGSLVSSKNSTSSFIASPLADGSRPDRHQAGIWLFGLE